MSKKGKVLVTLLAGCMAATGVVGCGGSSGSGGSGTATEITVMCVSGGIGRKWLDNAIARFQESVKDKSYEDNKTGVEFVDIGYEQDTQVSSMSTSGYNIYFTNETGTGLALSQKGDVIDITDIATEKIDNRDGVEVSIADKIETNYLNTMLKGADDSIYALPYYALYGGLTYNKDLFDEEGYYFAAPAEEQTEEVVSYTCDFGTASFIGQGNGKKSCGNDGEYGTEDDGAPSSLVELLILCSKLKEDGCDPFIVTGGHDNYTYYLESSLWASLAGAEEMSVRYSGDGYMTIVTSVSDELLFDNIDYIKKPITERVKIDATNRNLVEDSVYRYYAIAFQEIAYRENWFAIYSNQPECSHVDAMKHFYYSGKNGRPKMGMLIEGDYWHNEATDNDVPQSYQSVTGDSNRQVSWMYLPTSLDVSATEGHGREYCMHNTGNTLAFINANIAGNAGLVEACKDFLQFCYTDAELSKFSGLTGSMRKAMNYEVNTEDYAGLSAFSKSVLKVRTDKNTVSVDEMSVSWTNAQIYRPYLGRNYGSTFQALKLKADANTENIFWSRSNSHN